MIVNIDEAKTYPSYLVERAAAGEEIIIGKACRPLARLVPFVQRRQARTPGRWAGRVTTAPDFDETPAWLTDAFEGK
jgi:prevent-host-death family protein